MRIEPKKILCAIDFSEFSANILYYGKLLAAEFGSKLYLCHIVPGSINVSGHLPSYFDYSGVESELIENAEKSLDEMAGNLDLECEIIVSSGHPPTQIEYIAQEQKMDMVIAATHGGSGMKRFLIGSVTDRLVKVLRCPLLVLHGAPDQVSNSVDSMPQIKKILVGCDFSDDSKLAFEYALSLAQEFQTQLHLAHVIRPDDQIRFWSSEDMHLQDNISGTWERLVYPGAEKKHTDEIHQKEHSLYAHLEIKMLDMVPEDCRNWCTPMTAMLEGQPYKELVEYASKNQIDMIVLGVRGHSLLDQFLVGSTTDRVISQASCPVLAVRHTKT